jgi:NAD(P)H-dependent FMN reductase
MFYIPVVLGSIRRNRESIKVAQFALQCLERRDSVVTELLDLKELNLPMMEERLRSRNDADPRITRFSTKVGQADGILIVTPEYNSGYPGVLKNALDYLKPEYKHKPFGIVTVSAAESGGVLCLAALQQVVLHLGGLPIPATLPVPKVQELFSSEMSPPDPVFLRRADAFFDELLWFTEALTIQRRKASAVPILKS